MISKEDYFKSFLKFILDKLNLREEDLREGAKEELKIYLQYAKASSIKISLKEVKNIING